MVAIMRQENPEERELAIKRQELELLRSQLADAELKYHTFHAQLEAFKLQYFQTVGLRLLRIDDLQAKLAEARAALEPENEHLIQEASAARRHADTTGEAFEGMADAPPKESFKPSDDCRKLYLQAAKAMHPDLAPSPEDKERRHKFMAALNEAYEAGDTARIQRILQEWNSSPESICGDGVGVELIRVIRQIAQVQARLREIYAEIDTLQRGDLNALWTACTNVDPNPCIHLDTIAATLDQEIEVLEYELQAVCK